MKARLSVSDWDSYTSATAAARPQATAKAGMGAPPAQPV